jgi:hypothetical protein
MEKLLIYIIFPGQFLAVSGFVSNYEREKHWADGVVSDMVEGNPICPTVNLKQ